MTSHIDDDDGPEADPETVANGWGLVLKASQFMAGKCTRSDVLRFAYEKGLIPEDMSVAVLEAILADEDSDDRR